jgi:hypothetical protein
MAYSAAWAETVPEIKAVAAARGNKNERIKILLERL